MSMIRNTGDGAKPPASCMHAPRLRSTVDIANRCVTAVRRVSPFVVALVAQLLISVLLTPWNAPTDTAFHEGAKRALVIALMAHVIVRLILPRLLSAKRYPGEIDNTAELGQTRPPKGSWKFVFQAFAAAMLVALAFSIAIDKGFIGLTIGVFLCITAQQLAFATAAFHIQERAEADVAWGRLWLKPVVICVMALYSSRLLRESLFQTTRRIWCSRFP